MAGLIKKNKILIYSVLISVIWIGYYFLWIGQSESYQIKDMKEIEKSCYQYTSNEDLKNIARHEIIRLYGRNALDEQRKLNVVNIENSNEITVGSRPYGILKAAYLYFFENNFLTPLTVVLIKNSKYKCVYIESALYHKL